MEDETTERERLLSEFGLACEALAKEHMVSAELMRDALLDPGPGATWQATHGVERVVDLPVGTLRVAVGRTASDPGARDHWLNQARALRPKQYARPAVPAVAATEPRGARLNIVLAFGDGLDPDAVAREFMAGLESTGLKPREMALDQENELQRVKDERDSVAHRLATVIRERDQLQAELNALSDRVAQGGGDTYEKLEVACFILAPLVKGKHVPAPILRAVADILNLPK